MALGFLKLRSALRTEELFYNRPSEPLSGFRWAFGVKQYPDQERYEVNVEAYRSSPCNSGRQLAQSICSPRPHADHVNNNTTATYDLPRHTPTHEKLVEGMRHSSVG